MQRARLEAADTSVSSRAVLRARPIARSTVTAGAACLLLAGCGDDAPPPTYAVRDSAGIRIVESAAPRWGADDRWTVGAEPVLHIGVVEGDEEYQFSIIAGVYQRDNRIVVGDFAAAEVRFYDLEGMFLGSFGRRGDGPGEFAQLGWVQPYRGDSIVAWDQRGRRLSVFTREGEYVRSVAADPIVPPESGDRGEQMLWSPGGMGQALRDGTFLGGGGVVFQGQLGERVVGDTYFTRFSAEGDSLDSLGPFQSEVELRDFRREVVVQTAHPRVVFRAEHAGGLYVANSADFEILDISLDGALRRVLRSHHLDLRMTDAHREAFRASERVRLGESADPAALEAALSDVRFPARIPPISQLVVDSEGYLWARHYTTRWTPGDESWSVFAPDGGLLGGVETPERLQVRQIGPDYLLGIWTDDYDVRYVRKYRLER